MNTANKLTLFRFICIPAFLVVLYLESSIPAAYYIAFGIFVAACITDFLDGYIARHYNQITNFGKFMDPLADKVLVVAAMCYFVQFGQMPGWVLAIVLLREFGVSGLRLVAVEQGRVIAAGKSGKAKTALTMVSLCAMLFMKNLLGADAYILLCRICSYLIAAITVYSGAEYFIQNRDVFRSVQ